MENSNKRIQCDDAVCSSCSLGNRNSDYANFMAGCGGCDDGSNFKPINYFK